jgi:hypothetical protein
MPSFFLKILYFTAPGKGDQFNATYSPGPGSLLIATAFCACVYKCVDSIIKTAINIFFTVAMVGVF